MEPKYLTAKQVRFRFGGISTMSLWRWSKDQKLGFPRPLIINRRRFFRLDEIEAFEGRTEKARSVPK